MENKIDNLLNELKQLDLDGETAEDILEQLGLREQVLKQILDSEKYLIAKKVWDDIFNNETLIYNSFENYYFNKFIE